MTREEQIKSEANFSYNGNYKELQKQCFIEGAKWADENRPVDWQQVRIQAAIAAMQGILSNETRHDEAIESCNDEYTIWASIAIDSVEYANALVKELKGE